MTPDDDATFKKMVAYFWLEKGDPQRYPGWDEERCLRLMPEFYRWLMQHATATAALAVLARSYRPYNDDGVPR